MTTQANTIDIPGYNSEVDYGCDFGRDCILQQTYHFSWGNEIAFYNRSPDEVGLCESNVAVWHIRERY
jgi:hypothetical protein